MSRAIALGERAFVLGFKGVGFEIVPAKDGESASRELARIARERDVALVLVTESIAAEATEAIESFRQTCPTVLTTIPTHLGSSHTSFLEMRRAVEKSIGVDMLGKE